MASGLILPLAAIQGFGTTKFPKLSDIVFLKKHPTIRINEKRKAIKAAREWEEAKRWDADFQRAAKKTMMFTETGKQAARRGLHEGPHQECICVSQKDSTPFTAHESIIKNKQRGKKTCLTNKISKTDGENTQMSYMPATKMPNLPRMMGGKKQK